MEWKKVSEQRTPLAPGVILTRQVVEAGTLKETVQQIKIDTGHSGIGWYPVSSGGKVERLDTVRGLMQDAVCGTQNIIASVNGDFFSYAGVPSGLQMINQEIITSPLMTKVLMARWPGGRTLLKEQVAFQGELRDQKNKSLQLDAINRPRPNQNQGAAVLYNERFGSNTRTLEGGLEVLLECEYRGRLITGKQRVKVITVERTANIVIPPHHVILSLSGLKADWGEKWLKPGEEYTLNLDYEQDVGSAEQVISGNSTLAYVLIRNGEIAPAILDADVEHNHHRHPRTIAAVRDQDLYLFVIDGRQPGYSDGMTMAESAYYLRSLRMDFAINLDGGGSTTCFARLPGDLEPGLLNSPSDGMERAIGNAIVITNEMPRGQLSRLIISPLPSFEESFGRSDAASMDSPGPISILAGSTIAFTVKAIDDNLHPVAVMEEDIQWEVSPSLGRLNAQGVLSTVFHAASGEIICYVNGHQAVLPIVIHDDISTLLLKPEHAVVDNNGSLPFAVQAYDLQGGELLCSAHSFVWEADSGMGTAAPNGEFYAAQEASGAAGVRASYNGKTAEALVQIGRPPLVIVDFEQLDSINVTCEGVVPDTVQFKKAARPQPVRFGTFSGKLIYDFTDCTGCSRASIHFSNEEMEYGIPVEGRPRQISLWVYGDGQGHWLRLGIKDRYGHPVNVELTEQGGLDWYDWKYVSAELPEHLAYPISVSHISLVEYNDSNKNKGAVYFDQLRAIYIEQHEDVTGPRFSDCLPAPGEAVLSGTDIPLIISAVVMDEESGVDPASLSMWINNRRVEPDYNPRTGRVAWQADPKEWVSQAAYKVKLYAKDREGNPSVPAAEWSFEVTSPVKS